MLLPNVDSLHNTRFTRFETKFADQPVEILGFPCNQFGHQEPGTNEEIEKYCREYFGVTFPVLSKVETNGKMLNQFINFEVSKARTTRIT